MSYKHGKNMTIVRKMIRKTHRISKLLDKGSYEEIKQLVEENLFYHSSKWFYQSSTRTKFFNKDDEEYPKVPILYKAIFCFRPDVVKLLYEHGHRLGKFMKMEHYSCLWCCKYEDHCDDPLTMSFNIFSLMLKAEQIEIAKLMLTYEEGNFYYICRSKYGDMNDISTSELVQDLQDRELLTKYISKIDPSFPEELLSDPNLTMQMYIKWMLANK